MKDVQLDLNRINYPSANWLAPCNNRFDVVIIGAGMAGLCAAFALKCLGIVNLQVFDENVEGEEGPWVTYARMPTLRSTKELVGPALDVPTLTFRAWFESQFGLEAWEHLGKIPTRQWMEYLSWFKEALDLPVKNRSRLTQITPIKDGLSLTINGLETTTSKLVLATGRGGFGGTKLPEFARLLPKNVYAHTNDAIDFKQFHGKTIAIVGGGASGFDAAASAVMAGAKEVQMLLRREQIPTVNKAASNTYPGYVEGYYALSDSDRWAFQLACSQGTPPPRESFEHVMSFPNFNLKLSTAILNVLQSDKGVRLETTQGQLDFDFIIFATGFEIDGARQPELASFFSKIKLWKDIQGLQGPVKFFNSPYLGPHFQFLEKEKGRAEFLKDIYCFNYAATLSHGLLSSDIPGISSGASRLAKGIAQDFFVQNSAYYFNELQNYQTPEIVAPPAL